MTTYRALPCIPKSIWTYRILHCIEAIFQKGYGIATEVALFSHKTSFRYESSVRLKIVSSAILLTTGSQVDTIDSASADQPACFDALVIEIFVHPEV